MQRLAEEVGEAANEQEAKKDQGEKATGKQNEVSAAERNSGLHLTGPRTSKGYAFAWK